MVVLDNTFNNITSSRMTAQQFIKDGYGAPVPDYINILSAYKFLESYKGNDDIYKDTATTHNYFSVLTFLWKRLMVELYRSIFHNQTSTVPLYKKEITIGSICRELITNRVALEPSTKLFIEDMYKALYKKQKIGLVNHTYILGTSLRDYNLTSYDNIKLDLETLKPGQQTDKFVRNGNDLNKLISLYGVQQTVSIMHIILGIIVSYSFVYNRDRLDRFVTKYDIIPNPLMFTGMGGEGGDGGSGGTGASGPSVIIPPVVTPGNP